MANSGIADLSGLFGSGSGSDTSQSTMAPLMGMNQYMQYPTGGPSGGSGSSASGVVPGTVPGSGSLGGSNPTPNPNNFSYIVGAPGSANEVPNTNSKHLVPTFDPNYTQQYYNMLTSQLGSGLSGFNLQTILPSSGQTTGAGQLNAPLNATDQALQSFLSGGPTNVPGANQLTQMAQTGNPIDQTPAWQAMIASEQQNTAQNANNLREQFASGGALNSSPFATAMQQFYNQNTMNQNAQLTQAQATAQENAQNRALSAQQGIQGEAGQFGSQMQTLDQQSIQNMLNEFNYTLAQNNPMNQMFQQAALSSPGVAETPTTAQNVAGILGSIASPLSALFGGGSNNNNNQG